MNALVKSRDATQTTSMEDFDVAELVRFDPGHEYHVPVLVSTWGDHIFKVTNHWLALTFWTLWYALTLLPFIVVALIIRRHHEMRFDRYAFAFQVWLCDCYRYLWDRAYRETAHRLWGSTTREYIPLTCRNSLKRFSDLPPVLICKLGHPKYRVGLAQMHKELTRLVLKGQTFH